MVNWFSKKVQKKFNWESNFFSITILKQLNFHMRPQNTGSIEFPDEKENESWCLTHTIHKNLFPGRL